VLAHVLVIGGAALCEHRADRSDVTQSAWL
jgi:hypothetical protein